MQKGIKIRLYPNNNQVNILVLNDKEYFIKNRSMKDTERMIK